jgi:hypothetical protein
MLLTQTRIICSALISFSFAAFALAAVPQTINYQGYLKNGSVPASGPVNMTFSLYSSNPTRSNPVWRESKIVTPVNGIYGTQLGSVATITAPFDVPYFLGVQVENDPEMGLQHLSGTGYAFRAGVAESALTVANPQQHLLVQHAGSGSGTVASSPSGITTPLLPLAVFPHGAPVTLTATPDPYSTFGGWSGACYGAGTCVVSMNGLTTVIATFLRPEYTLNVSRTGNGTIFSSTGGLYCGARCSDNFPGGTTVTLNSVPDSGYTAIWSGDCSGAISACSVNMDSNRTIGTSFGYLLSTSLSGTGAGIIVSAPAVIKCPAGNCSSVLSPGTLVTFTAIPDPYSTFTGWTGCDSPAGYNCNFTMNQAKSITADFNHQYFTISVYPGGSNGASGSLTLVSSPVTELKSCSAFSICSYSYLRSSTISIAAIPDSGSTFVGWTNCPSPVANVCTLSNIQTGFNLQATFTKP